MAAETSVLIESQLTISSQTNEGVLLPDRGISINPINNLRFQHKKATVDPTSIALWLL